MNKFFLSLLLILYTFVLSAQEIQNNSNIWYFGDRAGLDFNTSPPTVLTDGQINTQEGIATISDGNGALLFYTDGITVWDRLHQAMPGANGTLNGHPSSTQSSIIVPNLSNPDLYYIFTVDELAGSNGLAYTSIDLSLAGNGSIGAPLGDVIAGEVNVPLVTPVTEKVTAVLNDNNKAYWLVAHGWNNNRFYAYEVTCDGVNTTPVISDVGNIHAGGASNINAVGYMKAPISGDQLALVNRNTGTIDLYDFDNTTGLVSNETEITPNDPLLYGIEFSLSGDYLFIGGRDIISRYELNTGILIDLAIDIPSVLSGTAFRALQLGPDENIYISVRDHTHISRINAPDEPNPSVEMNAIFLNPDGVGRNARFGLPNLFYFDLLVPDTVNRIACPNTTVEYNGLSFSAGTVNEVYFTDTEGCDSTIILIVEAHEDNNETIVVEACGGGFYDYNGVQIPAGSQANFNGGTDVNGCDSIVTVIVNINNVITESFDTYLVCEGESYSYGTLDLPIGTDTTFQEVNLATGCDHFTHVMVNAFPDNSQTLVVEACDGGFYDYNGVQIPAGSQANFNGGTDVNGCDSMVTVMVNVNNVITESFDTYLVCEGESYSYGTLELPIGTDTTFQEVDLLTGCDHLSHVIVNAFPDNSQTLTVEACEGGFYDYNGLQIPTGSQASFNGIDVNGCDSSFTVLVNVSTEAIETFLDIFVCETESYTYNNEAFSIGTDTSFVFTDLDLCDSIVYLTVNAYEENNEVFEVEVCDGSFYEYNGIQILGGTQESFSYTDSNGCDSTFTIIVNGLDAIENAIDVSICQGEDYSYRNQTYPIGTDTILQFFSQTSCDTFVHLTVGLYPVVDFNLVGEKSCWNMQNGSLSIQEISGGLPPYEFSLDGQNFLMDTVFNNLSFGNYKVQLKDANNCIYEETIDIIEIPEIVLDYPEKILECNEDSLLFSVTPINNQPNDLNWFWSTGATTNTIYISNAGNYVLEVSNECQSLTEEIKIKREGDLVGDFIYIPNAFSPNGDGTNDLFKIFPASAIEVVNYEIQIFNRWGALVFQSRDINFSWDGNFNKKELGPGIYTWWMKMDLRSCRRELQVFKKGDISILR